MKRNLDSLNIPIQIEALFPEKIQMYEQMRLMEQQINEFMHQKLLGIKEDLLATAQQAKVKRNLKILIEINHSLPKLKEDAESSWAFKIEGKLDTEMADEELLKN